MSTINKIEVEKFSKLAKDWWNPNGKFKPLHLFNPARIKFIKEKLISYYGFNPKIQEPLKKINILDVGCGGGLLCEPLKRLGATITGIDASISNIEAAKLHAKEMKLNINYIHCPPEKLKLDNKFDVILNMEIVEHVANVDLFIQSCSKLVKKNGYLYITTPDLGHPKVPDNIKEWDVLCPPIHVQHFTKKTVSMLFSRYSFQIVKFYKNKKPGLIFLSKKF